jgi:hypothetical protein
MNSLRPWFFTLCFGLLVVLIAPAGAVVNQYTEDFTTTQKKDALNTTANWNTTAGRLELFPFVPTIAGSVATPDRAQRVFVSGDHAYVANGTSGLVVIDISDPTTPDSVGAYDTPSFAQGVSVAGDYAYVADGGAGLKVINISNPAAPALVGGISAPPGLARGVFVSGDYAYLANGTSGLVVIDISNPAAPTLAGGSYDTPDVATDVFIAGDHAYVADGLSGLQVIDISTPTAPTLAGSYNTLSSAEGVFVSGDHAYVADHNAGFVVIDISDPTAPALAGIVATSGEAYGVFVSGDRAYVADGPSSLLQVIDISNPAVPILAGSVPTPGAALGVFVEGDHAYLADQYSGLQVINIADPVPPTLAGGYDTAGQSQAVIVAGDHAYLADGFSDLQVIDISDPTTPVLDGSIDLPFTGFARGVYVTGDYVYVADERLNAVDISDPTTPTLAGSYNTPGVASGVFVAGDHAYVADDDSGLVVVDISDPTTPTLAGTYDTPSSAFGVFVAGDHAYVADGDSGLLVVDISDPTNPTLAGSVDTPGYAVGVVVSGDHAYVADGSSLQVIDISDPTTPVPAGSYTTSGFAGDVFVAGDHAYVGYGTSGLVVVDISDPTTPVLVGNAATPGGALGVFVAGDHAYVADNQSGLQVIEVMQRRFNLAGNIGQSFPVDDTADIIYAARLTTTQVDAVQWELSADAGSNWQVATPGGGLVQLASGSDLLWRATLSVVPPFWATSPGVSQLDIEWLSDSPVIDAITDVANDQGRQVRVEWTRSGRDFTGEPSQIYEYSVYRKIDPNLSSAAEVAKRKDRDIESVLSQDDHHARVIAAGWHFVTTVPARAEDEYAVVVPTLKDSTISEGPYNTTFFVSALTGTPGIFFDSQPDSGYSLDNLEPGVPAGFAVVYNKGSGNELSWDTVSEPDFQYYRVYRGGDENFTPDATNLVHEAATTGWTDPEYDGGGVHYKVTAVDDAGNESMPASPETATAADGPVIPTRFALYQNVPNPFNPTTTIAYDVADPGGVVTLRIYDVSGKLIRTLVEGVQSPGQKRATWNGKNDRGQRVASGVYFYRLRAPRFDKTRKMVLVQ